MANNQARARGLLIAVASKGERVAAPVAPVPAFCSFMTFATLGDTWDVPAVFNNTEQTITLENTAGLALGGFLSNQTWKASEGVVSFENEIVQIDDAANFDQVIGIFDALAAELIAGVYITSAGGGDLRDPVTGTPLGSIVAGAGYKCGFKFDAGAAQATLYDNQLNEFNVAANPVFDANNDLALYMLLGAFDANKFVNKINTGSRAFALPQSVGVYCDQVYNPPALCGPATIIFSQLPPPNDQTMILTGAQLQTVETTSLGNSGIQSAALAIESFQTLTDEVKFELYLLKDTTTAGGAFAVFFVDVSTFTILAGVSCIPAAGMIFDVVAGAPLVTSQVFTPNTYKIAPYLKASDGTARFKDTNSNDLPLAVDPAYLNTLTVNMGSVLNAGPNVGEELDATLNFGNTAFQLGEDAQRGCEV